MTGTVGRAGRGMPERTGSVQSGMDVEPAGETDVNGSEVGRLQPGGLSGSAEG